MPFTAVCLGSIGAGKTRLLTQLTQSVNKDTEEIHGVIQSLLLSSSTQSK